MKKVQRAEPLAISGDITTLCRMSEAQLHKGKRATNLKTIEQHVAEVDRSHCQDVLLVRNARSKSEMASASAMGRLTELVRLLSAEGFSRAAISRITQEHQTAIARILLK